MTPIKPELLIQIDSGYFCAVVCLWDDRVLVAAPILKYMLGWTKDRVLEYAKEKKWKTIEILDRRKDTE